MKGRLISCVILGIVMTLFSCGRNSGSEDALKQCKKVYNFSISNGDYITAEGAVCNEWALDSANALNYQDTLANLYIRNEQYVQAVIVGKKILTKRADDIAIMEMVGVADQNINNFKEALFYYQVIYSKIHDLFHLYKIAVTQYDLGNMNDCNQTIDQILADSNSVNEKTTIVGQPSQIVSYKAAALNVRGVVARSLKQTDVARKAFNDALTIEPDFVLAKDNLQGLK